MEGRIVALLKLQRLLLTKQINKQIRPWKYQVRWATCETWRLSLPAAADPPGLEEEEEPDNGLHHNSFTSLRSHTHNDKGNDDNSVNFYFSGLPPSHLLSLAGSQTDSLRLQSMLSRLKTELFFTVVLTTLISIIEPLTTVVSVFLSSLCSCLFCFPGLLVFLRFRCWFQWMIHQDLQGLHDETFTGNRESGCWQLVDVTVCWHQEQVKNIHRLI